MKFCARVRLKPSNDRGEFELDRARSKNNIAENSIALGHEMDTSTAILVIAELEYAMSHGRHKHFRFIRVICADDVNSFKVLQAIDS